MRQINRDLPDIRREKTKMKKRIIICLLLLSCFIGIIIVIQNNHNSGKRDEFANVNNENDIDSNIKEVSFPYKSKGENLAIASIFPYSGTNPDFNDENCENIGAIQVMNQSDEYLIEAEICAILSDGSKLQFLLEDIPPKKEVLAFEVKNQQYNQEKVIVDIEVTEEFSTEHEFNKEDILYEVNGEKVNVINNTSVNLTEVIVRYHACLNEMYFGGSCYETKIQTLAAGESVVVNATECLVGEVTVVNIIY